jgi:hypothetical protein
MKVFVFIVACLSFFGMFAVIESSVTLALALLAIFAVSGKVIEKVYLPNNDKEEENEK